VHRLLFGLTIFLSAFLLFQVQLIVAKNLLPWFGGAATVWTTCQLFFQVLFWLVTVTFTCWRAGASCAGKDGSIWHSRTLLPSSGYWI
jgi:hypothetical protein